MKLLIVSVLLIGSVTAGGDNKDAPKSKRAYSLGYDSEPYFFNQDVINHQPLSSTVVHHAPIVAPFIANAPLVSHAPIVAHAPVVSAIAPVAEVISSIVSTNVHHYPSYRSYNPYNSYVASHAPLVASSYYYAPAPAAYAHSSLYT